MANGDNLELQATVAAMLEQATGRAVDYQGDISPSLGVHTGPGLVGIGVQID
nr:hypothetical protein [Lacticaseibacillus sharpeae]